MTRVLAGVTRTLIESLGYLANISSHIAPKSLATLGRYVDLSESNSECYVSYLHYN